MTPALVQLFEHNLWANMQLLDVCATLTEEQLDASVVGTYGRVRDTLFHLFAAEELCVGLLRGHPLEKPLRPEEGFPGFPALRDHARRSGEALIEVAGEVEPDHVLQGSRRGQPFFVTAIVPLIQAINHATEHRAHIVTILSQHGVEPVSLDGWTYAREVLKQGAPGFPAPKK